VVKLCNWPLIILAMLWVSLASTTANASAIAQVDRTVVAVDETFSLTISIDQITSTRTPNIDSLRSNFSILRIFPTIKSSVTNNHSEALTQWEITLMPKHVGQMIIPSFNIEGEKTQPIAIEVRPSVPISQADILPVYLESEVEDNEIYVQQQLIYVVRLFQSIQIDNVKVHTPEFDNAALKQLSHNIYNRRIKNVRYRVNEWRFAIFPQASGELTIPESVLTANEAVGGNSFFGRLRQGKAIRKMSTQHNISVKEVPRSFSGNTWLPAESIKLVETWSSSPGDIRVGESITRSIQIKAEGLMGSQLPPIDFPVIEGIKLYPDKPQIDNSENEKGVSTSRIDSTALIPTREGSITLPEVRIAWWDTKADKMREARIPQSTLNVKPALNDITTFNPAAIDHSQSAQATSSEVVIVNGSNIIYWQLACAVLALVWLYTLYLLLSVKRQAPVNRPTNTQIENNTPPSEKQAYKALANVCHNNDIQNVRQSVVQWAQAFWPDEPIHSLQDVQNRCNHSSLINALHQLDNSLYGHQPDTTRWNGESLLTVIKLLKEKDKKESGSPNTMLAPLYPS
jgi:BatD DUF11 like domain